MKLSEILQLKEAGYSAEEIQALASVITEEPEPAPVPAPAQNNYDDRFAAIEEQMKQMSDLIQKSAIRSTNITNTDQAAQPSLLSIANTILGGKES